MNTLPHEFTIIVGERWWSFFFVERTSRARNVGGIGVGGVLRRIVDSWCGFFGPSNTVQHELSVMFDTLRSSFDYDEAEFRVVTDDTGKVIVDSVLLDFELVGRIREITNLERDSLNSFRFVLDVLLLRLRSLLFRCELASFVLLEMFAFSESHLSSYLSFDFRGIGDRVLSENSHHVRDLDCFTGSGRKKISVRFHREGSEKKETNPLEDLEVGDPSSAYLAYLSALLASSSSSSSSSPSSSRTKVSTLLDSSRSVLESKSDVERGERSEDSCRAIQKSLNRRSSPVNMLRPTIQPQVVEVSSLSSQSLPNHFVIQLSYYFQ